MSKKIAVFAKKLNNKTIPEKNIFFINLLYNLKKVGYLVEIYDQNFYQKSYLKSKTKNLQRYFNNFVNKSSYPFFSKKITDCDFEIFDHTISQTSDKQIINVKPFYLKGHFYFDRLGFSGWSEICKDKSILSNSNNKNEESFFLSHQNDIIGNNKSKYHQIIKNESLPRDFSFFPIQLEGDSVNKLCKLKTIDLLQYIIKIFSNSSKKLVIKRHPKCKSKKIEKILYSTNKVKNIIISNESIHNLINKSNSVIVNNSGVGFESLLHLKPIYTFGKSDYEIVTRRVNIDNFDIEKFEILSSEEIKKIKTFFYNVVYNYTIDCHSEASYIRAFKRTGIVE